MELTSNMRLTKISLLGVFAGLLVSSLKAEPTDYYLDVQSVGGGGTVTINGFQLYDSGARGTGFSAWLTPYLRRGENLVQVDFHALEKQANARFEFKVVAHPHTGGQRDNALETNLANGALTPRSELWLTELPDEAIEFLAGRRLENGKLAFAVESDGRVALGIRLKRPEDFLKGRPLSIDYVALSEALTEVEIHFSRQDQPAHLAYRGLAFGKNMGDQGLPVEAISEGIRWIDDATFDTIWISGQPLSKDVEINLQSCKLHSLLATASQTHRFIIEEANAWPWETGANVAAALADPAQRAALVARLREIHGVVSTQPAKAWLPLFALKTQTYATAMVRDLETIAGSQEGFFHRLRSHEGWDLEPFSPARLQLIPVNDHVVRARYVDSEGPLISVPLQKANARRPDRFTIPLYLALVDGRWEIVL